MAKEEATIFDTLLEFFVIVTDVCLTLAHLQCLLVDISLNVFEQSSDVISYALKWSFRFLQGIATHYFDSAFFDIARSENKANGNALKLVVSKFETGTLVVCVIVFYAYSG